MNLNYFYRKSKLKQSLGQSLLEILIAVAIFSTLVVVLIMSISQLLKRQSQAGDTTLAAFTLQKTMEDVYAIAQTPQWNDDLDVNNTYYIQDDGAGGWNISTTTPSTEFVASVKVDPVYRFSGSDAKINTECGTTIPLPDSECNADPDFKKITVDVTKQTQPTKILASAVHYLTEAKLLTLSSVGPEPTPDSEHSHSDPDQQTNGVGNGNDDADKHSPTQTGNSTIELGGLYSNDGNDDNDDWMGLRFTGIDMPEYSTIMSAEVFIKSAEDVFINEDFQYTCYGQTDTQPAVNIPFGPAGTAESLCDFSGSGTGRTCTTETHIYEGGSSIHSDGTSPLWATDDWYMLGNMADVFQDVVDTSSTAGNWDTTGGTNVFTLLCRGDNLNNDPDTRLIYSYDNDPNDAPELAFTFITPTPPPPVPCSAANTRTEQLEMGTIVAEMGGSPVSGTLAENTALRYNTTGSKYGTSFVPSYQYTSEGTLDLNADGSYNYTPPVGFSGSGYFPVQINVEDWPGFGGGMISGTRDSCIKVTVLDPATTHILTGSSWGAAGDWSPPGIPGAAASVLIPAGAGKSISADFTISNLFIEPGATLTQNAGTTLSIQNSLVSSGILDNPGAITRIDGMGSNVEGNLTDTNLAFTNSTSLSFPADIKTIAESGFFASGQLDLSYYRLTADDVTFTSGTESLGLNMDQVNAYANIINSPSDWVMSNLTASNGVIRVDSGLDMYLFPGASTTNTHWMLFDSGNVINFGSDGATYERVMCIPYQGFTTTTVNWNGGGAINNLKADCAFNPSTTVDLDVINLGPDFSTTAPVSNFNCVNPGNCTDSNGGVDCTFICSSSGPLICSLDPKVDYATANQPLAVAAEDLNGDSDADLVVANGNSSSISVYINNGDGTYAPKVDYTVGGNPSSVDIGDVDGDTFPDLAVANRGTDSVSIMINNGNGTFAPKVDYGTDVGPTSVALGDLNNDNWSDMAATSFNSYKVHVFINNGDGTFAPRVNYSTNFQPMSVDIADLDGNNWGDMAVANSYAFLSPSTASVYINNGDGTFAPKVDYNTASMPYSVKLRDLNADSRPEMVVASYGSNIVSVFQNNGSGAFGPRVDYSTGSWPWAVDVGDLDGDSFPDLATANSNSDTVSVFLNAGNGYFAPKVDYNTGASPRSIAVMDLDNNFAADIAVGNRNSDTVSVLINQCVGSPPMCSLDPKVDYATANQPLAVAAEDLNGDSDADLVVANGNSSSISVYINNGDGTYAPKVDYTVGGNPSSVDIGDVDGDTFPDLAVANRGTDSVSIMINNGNGTFAPKVDYGTDVGPTSVALGDLNNDNWSDMAATSFNSYKVHVFINNGDGTFAPRVNYSTNFQPMSVDIADLDGNNWGDMAVANSYAFLSPSTASVYINNGDGTFAPKVDYNTASMPYSVKLRDLNADSRPEMVVASYGSNIVSVFQNNGSGAFGPRVDYSTGSWPWAVDVGDLDGDSFPDLATANSNSDTVSVFLNAGNGYFGPKSDYNTGASPRSIAVMDLDNNFAADIAVGNRNSDTVSVLINQCVGSPTISAYNDSVATDLYTPYNVDVLANDTGPVDPAQVSVTSAPANGTTSVDAATGAITYNPTGSFSGNDSFDYQVCDSSGIDCATATVTVTVNATCQIWANGTAGGSLRAGHTANVVDNKIYLWGGSDAVTLDINTMDIYDPINDSWPPASPGGTARRHHTGSVIGNTIYYHGGYNNLSTLSSVDTYTPSTNGWSTGTSGPSLAWHAAQSYLNNIYYWRGSTIHIYDPAFDSWSSAGSGGTSRYSTSVNLYNNKFYYWGGTNGFSAFNIMDIYDPIGDSWSSGTAGGTARNEHTGIYYKNKIYFWGGFDNTSTVLNTVDIYDPVGDSWSSGTAGGTARTLHSGNLVNHKFYYLGGNVGAWPYFNSVDIYNPHCDPLTGIGASTPTPTLTPTPTNTPTPTPTPCSVWTNITPPGTVSAGRYMASGNINNKFYYYQDTTIVSYDPATDTWDNTLSSSPFSREMLDNQAIEYNGNIIFFGGNQTRPSIFDPVVPQVEVQMYTPSTDTWTQLPSMPVAYEFQSNVRSGNFVYQIGSVFVPYFHRYNLLNNNWSSGFANPTNRWGASVAAYGNTLYWFNGYRYYPTPPSPSIENTTLVYNMGTGVWSNMTPSGKNKLYSSGLTYSNKFFNFGGLFMGGPFGPTNQVDIYDFASDNWVSGTSGGGNRQNPAVNLYNSKFYLWGGSTGGSPAINGNMSIYDPHCDPLSGL